MQAPNPKSKTKKVKNSNNKNSIEERMMMMANRERKITLRLMVTDEERKLIYEKMLQAGTTNFSLYSRKMLIDGYVIRRDFSEIKSLTKELSNLARSINQIALRANETRSIYLDDVKALQVYYRNVRRACIERLVKMID